MAVQGEDAAITGVYNVLLMQLSTATLRIDTEYPAQPTIFKVPSVLRNKDQNSYYSPETVSIGPYHCGSPNLAEMHRVKLQYLADLVQRTSNENENFLKRCSEIAYHRETEAREQYAEAVGLSLEEFVMMMVIDGCFIVEFLIKWYLNQVKTQIYPVKAKLHVLRTDLLLVENQIPFFILEEFFKAAREFFKAANRDIPQLNEDMGLIELALVYFSGDRFQARVGAELYHDGRIRIETTEAGEKVWPLVKIKDLVKIQHLLHLYHFLCLEPMFVKQLNDRSTKMRVEKLISTSYFLLPIFFIRSLTWLCVRPIFCALFWLLFKILGGLRKVIELAFLTLYLLVSTSGLVRYLNGGGGHQNNFSGIPNASYLRDTGFKFKKKDPLSCFSYVTHKGRTIKIPALSIQFTTLALLKNLIAFEQCPFWDGKCFTAFATLMDYLIDTAEDVAVLKEHGIIDKGFGDDEMVASFFNGLCKDISFNHEQHYLRKSIFEYVTKYYIENYYQVKFYQWRKKLIPDYFSNPWAVPSMIAAFIALVLTAVSTFYTIYPYYYPRS